MNISGLGSGAGYYGQGYEDFTVKAKDVNTVKEAKAEGFSQSDIDKLEKQGKLECETCKNRKYQDGSDEMVSFKSAAHISPESAASKVMAHEQEHVRNSYAKAEDKDGEVLQASVKLKTDTCPECGRTYVSGGETTTQIKYNSDEYAKNSKAIDAANVPGRDVDVQA